MTRTITFCVLVTVIGVGGWLSAFGTTQKSALVPKSAAMPKGPLMSRREHMARLVAEAAAINAEKTARSALARKAASQETAAR